MGQFSMILSRDPGSALSANQQHYDSGNLALVDFDPQNNEIWSRRTQFIDSEGQNYAERIVFDNGTTTESRVDVYKTSITSDDWKTFDINGNITTRIPNYDDGTRTASTFDAKNEESWSQCSLYYNEDGQLIQEYTENDDGSFLAIDYDFDLNDTYREVVTSYSALGVADFTWTYSDDGARVLREYDDEDTEIWHSAAFEYDNNEKLNEIVQEFDDGSSVILSARNFNLSGGIWQGADVKSLRPIDISTANKLRFIGNDMEQAIWGNAGENVLIGRGGGDEVRGQAGADSLWAGKGQDFIYCGIDSDVDRVIFAEGDSGKKYSKGDRIWEFDNALDLIDLSKIDADAARGDQKLRFVSDFAPAKRNQADGQLMVDSGSSGFRVSIDVNGDSKLDMLLRVMSNELARDDFIL